MRNRPKEVCVFADKPVDEFLAQLASAAPTPGGGSVAALAGALAAGLGSMVCYLTLGKEKYQAVQDDINQLLAETEKRRLKLMSLIEQDVEAYGRMAASYKMPRATDAEKQARTATIQEAVRGATLVPLSIAETCAELIDLCPPLVEKGNVNAVSDMGVAVLLAEASLRSALLNVMINLPSIKDEEFANATRQRMSELTQGKAELKERVMKDVEAKL